MLSIPLLYHHPSLLEVLNYYSCHNCSVYCIGTVVSQLSRHVKGIYKQTRLDVGKDTWPPEQPKDFTPVVLVHYEEQRTTKDVNIITKAVHTGHISDVISAASSQPVTKHHQLDSHQPLREALQTSKVTRNVADILKPFDQCDDPQTILIEGAPGIGKSILMKHISYCWAEGDVMKKIQLVLLICLRDPGVQKMSSLQDLLQSFCERHVDASYLSTVCAKVVFQDKGRSTAVLLDGYDEFPEGLRENSLIADIINRKVLPECGLIVSSRPHASQHLHNKATLRVDILGFTETEREHFIQQSLKTQPHKIPQLTNYLHHHTTINSLCFTPFHLLVLLFLFKKGYPLPNNSTELYKLFISLTICRHLAKYGNTVTQPITDLNNLPYPCGKIIQQLSKLSLQALNNNQLIITLEQIKSVCSQLEAIPGAINGFGLLQVVEHIDIFYATKTFNFIHFSIQEYLAAHYVANLPSDEERSILEEYFWSDIHYNMFNHYVTLTKGQRPSFKLFLRSGNKAITIDDKFLEDELQGLRFYRIFYEAGDISTCKTIEEKFTDKEISLASTTLSPNNLEDLTTLLTCSSCRNWKRINLGSCHIQDYGLRLLHRSLHHSNITIDDLWLRNNVLSSSSDNSLSDIVITCKVKVLNISNNKAVGETPHFFTTLLTHPSCVIEKLYMWDNNYSTTRPVVELFSSLRENKTVKELWITGNNISDDECGVICDVLHVNHTLRRLYIHDNPITGQASQLILDALKNNNTLERLALPSYPEDIKKEITSLQQVVNEKRRRRGCDVKLRIVFYWL